MVISDEQDYELKVGTRVETLESRSRVGTLDPDRVSSRVSRDSRNSQFITGSTKLFDEKWNSLKNFW